MLQGVAGVPDGRDADLRLLQVGVGEARRVQHGLGSALGLGAGDVTADAVDVGILGGG